LTNKRASISYNLAKLI